MDRIVGIDLGTSTSCLALILNGEPVVVPDSRGTTVSPSYIHVMEDGKILVGLQAKVEVISDPYSTIWATKRLIGRRYDDPEVQQAKKYFGYDIVAAPDGTVRVKGRDKVLSPTEVSAVILKYLTRIGKRYIGEEIKKVVITVPAYFTDPQRKATREAGAMIGLDVVRLLNEPTAAALAYGYDQDAEQTIAIYDLGGGTFDLSILAMGQGVFEVVATEGDSYLGGEDFDNRLVDFLVNDFKKKFNIDIFNDKMAHQRVKDAAERAKVALSVKDEVEINLPAICPDVNRWAGIETTITRKQYEDMVADLVERTTTIFDRLLKSVSMTRKDIDNLILVGGMTRMPMVRRKAAEYYGREPDVTLNPDEAVAIGAAIYAASLSGEKLLKKRRLVEAAPSPLESTRPGVAVNERTRPGVVPGQDQTRPGIAPSAQVRAPARPPAPKPPPGPPPADQGLTRPAFTDQGSTRPGAAPPPPGPAPKPPVAPPPMSDFSRLDLPIEKAALDTSLPLETEPAATAMPDFSHLDLPVDKTALDTSLPLETEPAATAMPDFSHLDLPVDKAALDTSLPLDRQALASAPPAPPEPPAEREAPPLETEPAAPAPEPAEPEASPAPAAASTGGPGYSGFDDFFLSPQEEPPAPPPARGPVTITGPPPVAAAVEESAPEPSAPSPPRPDLEPEEARTLAPPPAEYDDRPRSAGPIVRDEPEPPVPVAASAPEYVNAPVLLDVLSQSVGIGHFGGHFVPLVKRFAKLPARSTQVFTTCTDNQDRIRISVLQGESRYIKGNTSLGEFVLEGIERGRRGVAVIEVSFDIDQSGLFTVSARDNRTGAAKEVRIENFTGGRSGPADQGREV